MGNKSGGSSSTHDCWSGNCAHLRLSPFRVEFIRGWVPVSVESIRGWVPVGFESILGWVPIRIESFRGWVHSGLSPIGVEYLQGWVPLVLSTFIGESIQGWVHLRLSPFGVESIQGWVHSCWFHLGLGPVGVGSIRGWVFLGSVILGSVGGSRKTVRWIGSTCGKRLDRNRWKNKKYVAASGHSIIRAFTWKGGKFIFEVLYIWAMYMARQQCEEIFSPFADLHKQLTQRLGEY